MKHKKKRITAFLVFIATFFSFLPLNLTFNEQEAKAAVINKDITVLGMGTSNIKANSVGENEFSLENGQQNIFIGVKNGVNTDTSGNGLNNGETGITKQIFELDAINGVDVSGVTDFDSLNSKLSAAMGTTIDVSGVTETSALNTVKTNRGSQTLTVGSYNLVGINLLSLPYGVNTIKYKVHEFTVTKDENGVVGNEVENIDPVGTSNTITIYHGTSYLQGTITSIESISYLGATKSQYNDSLTTDEKTNNKTPFKYNDLADKGTYPLQYTFNVPDSFKTLDYVIHFDSNISNSAELLLNGQDYSAEVGNDSSGNSTISGSFTSVFDTSILVIKFTNSSNQQDLIKTYALQLSCKQLNKDEDYTLRDAGLVKYEYDSEDDVPAYIGKEFTRISSEDSVMTYEGNLYIDPRAKMISINPTVGASSQDGMIFFDYKDETTTTKNGKKFVDFSETNKVIILEGYGYKNGSVDYSNILVRYKFKVIQSGNGEASNVNLDFGDTAYLTQPGRETKISFNENRYSYAIYCEDRINVELTSPQTSKNEYIRVWFGNTVNSTQLTEANASVENNQKDTGSKSNKLENIPVGNYQKIVIQAYYDKEIKDANTNEVKDVKTYEVGHQYVFYIMKNIGESDTTTEVSTDASLKDLDVEDGKLIDTDGNKGFSSDMYTYTVTVPKDNTYAEVTAVTNTTVKEITATIKETGDQYDMTSGTAIKLPLNDSGTTTIKIDVTATDGINTKSYTLIVQNNEKSSECTLENLIVTPGDYTFDPDKDETKVRVDLNVKEVELTPVPKNEKSKIYVDDEVFSGTAKTIDLRNNQEVEVEIEVVSEDGTASNSYTVVITRRDADDIDTDDGKDDSDVFYDEYNECWVDTSKYEEWGKINGKDVYFDKNGRQVKDSWITTGKYGNYTYYYLNDKGYKYTGWLTDSTGKKYFLDQNTGSMHVGLLNENNIWYYFDKNGTMHTGWLYTKEVNNWQYFLQSGQMVTNTTMSVDGKVYNFGIDGYIF